MTNQDTFAFATVEDIHVSFTAEGNRLITRLVNKFGNDMAESIRYYRECRKSGDYEKTYDDTLIGKKAEFFVAKAMRDVYGFEYLMPDLRVYGKHEKSWESDLPYRRLNPSLPNFHVKSCSHKTIDITNSRSWTFQLKNDKGRGGRDAIFDSKDLEMVVLVYMDNFETDHAVIQTIAPFGALRTHLRLPFLLKHFGRKVCLYEREMKECGGEFDQWVGDHGYRRLETGYARAA